MLGAGSKSQMPTAEELKQCQKHAKVCSVCGLVFHIGGGGKWFVSPEHVVCSFSISLFFAFTLFSYQSV